MEGAQNFFNESCEERPGQVIGEMLSPVHSVPVSMGSAGLRGDECLFSSTYQKIIGLKHQKSNP